MSWLNFNDSLNQIKGQITNLATSVLNEGILQELGDEDVSKTSDDSVNFHGLNHGDGKQTVDPGGRHENETLRNRVEELEKEKAELVVSLEQLDLDCQRTTENLLVLREELRGEYEELKVRHEKLEREHLNCYATPNLEDGERLKNEIRLLKEKIAIHEEKRPDEHLLLQLDELKIRHEKLEREHQNCSNIEDSELLKKEIELLKEKCTNYEENIPDPHLLLQLNDLKVQHEKLLQEHQNCLKAINTENCERLQEEIQLLKTKISTFEETQPDKNLLLQLENFRETEAKLTEKYQNLEADISGKIQAEKHALHEAYVKIITENTQKYMEIKADEEISLALPQNDPLIHEFGQKVENLLKLFLYFKNKTDSLEKELYTVKQEKNDCIREKNFEIEKLLKNSEILSQEVITKSHMIKDYKNECAELMKNNDALIADIKTYQNTSGLQTISESNEDNILLLETELSNTNQKIKDMEVTISETETELDYIKLQLNLTGQELNRSKEDFHELSLRYKQLQEEEGELRFSLEKLKSDYENVEYKCEETKVNFEAAHEENQFLKQKIEESENLKQQNDKSMEELQNLQKCQKEAEEYAKNLVEKLQNSKMIETKLKLQIDTISKEFQASRDANRLLMSENEDLQGKLQDGSRVAWEDFERTKEDLKSLNETNEILLKEKEELVAELCEINIRDERIKTEVLALEEAKEVLTNEKKKLEGDLEEKNEANQSLIEDLERAKSELANISSEFLTLKWQVENAPPAVEEKTAENEDLQNRIKFLETQLAETVKSRDEIIALVKVKHDESDRYYKEIQRLTQLLSVETEKAEKLQQSFSEDRVVLERAVIEKTAAVEKEQAVGKELERLRIHLVDIEETYTRELMDAEQKNKEMQEQLNEIVKREKDSSSIYTSVSIRANQQVETLQKQLQLVTNQRDELNVKLSNYEDQNNKQVAALTNLQLVLNQFQKDKDTDVTRETERIRRQITVERAAQEELRKEIFSLKTQLEESKQGLQAASRLSDQLQKCQQQISNFKEQEKKLLEQLQKSESICKDLSVQTDSKVDKTLMKNLMLGYVNASKEEEKRQTLKIISTILSFNREECDRVNLNKQDGGWLKSFLQPQVVPNRDLNQETLSQAFVRFLENESKPVELPNLLPVEGKERRISDTHKPQSLLKEMVLPTFGEFERSRNSGSILKDVLKDTS